MVAPGRGVHRVVDRGGEVSIPAAGVSLQGLLSLPPGAVGVVLFAHGSGSGRLSPRNQYVAAELNDAGLSTLLFDLLTEAESADRRNVFDIGLLSDRLLLATAWMRAQPERATLPLGYFGASTGAAAALAAAARDREVRAVVSRGGRPDMAMPLLEMVAAPTLLIVGGNDREVLQLNRAAFERLNVAKRLEVVPGAGHLFEEPGALERVAHLARDWFLEHLPRESRA